MNRDSEHTERNDKAAADESVVEEQEIDMLLGDDDDMIPAAFRETQPPVAADVSAGDVEADVEADDAEGELVVDEYDYETADASDDGDLEGLAVAAAQEAISASQAAIEQAEQATLLLSKAEAAKSPRRWLTKRERMMALLLLFNIVLIGMMAAAPGLFRNDNNDDPDLIKTPQYQNHTSRNDPDYGPDIRRLDDRFPDDNLYEAAMTASRRGEYPKATRLLKRLLKKTPDMSGVQLRLVYGQLAYNLLRDGRKQEAEEYADRIDRMRVQTTLPEDLVRAARRAHRDGRGGDMRRYYARFLLQQSQIRSDMRDVIAEAYLRIGDSYRLDAEAGEKAQREQEAKRQGK